MKIEKSKIKIVCDMHCGNLSTYRLTFDENHGEIHLCESCFLELKKAILKGDQSETRKSKI